MTEPSGELDSIGQRLRWAREQAGLSQGQAAKTLGMHRPTISQIEAGQRNVRAEEVTRFGELYDVREEWILRGNAAFAGRHDPRIELAARELKKLNPDDLEKVLQLLSVLRSEEGNESA